MRFLHGFSAALLVVGACTTVALSGLPVERYAEWNGRRLHYQDAGLGEDAIVLVHGWASSTVTWRHQFPALADGARVLVVDLPGHGQSDPPGADYTMALFADALAAVMDDAGVERGVLVGHSNGAPVILNFYRRYPERTLGLVAVDGPLKRLFTAEQVEPMFAPMRGDDWRDAVVALIASMQGPGLSDEDRATISDMALATRHEAVVGGFEAGVDPRAWSDGPIDVPLLVLLAEQPTWDAAYESWVRERAPHVQYTVWSDVGHFIQMERPEAFRATLEDFLAANEVF